MTLDLTLPHRLWRGLHNALAPGVPRWVRVPVRPQAGHFVIRTDRREIAVPSAMRWEHYRFGWDRRVARLFGHFSIGEKIGLRPGDAAIDIGANVGEVSLGLAALGAEVLAIEGDPAVYDCLAWNVRKEPRIAPVSALVWSEARTLSFYSAPTRADSSIFRPADPQAMRKIELPAQPLDTLARDFGRDGIAFLKCDAEGAEPEVLEGATETLRRTRQIAIDTGPERMGEETSDACAKILQGLGFSVSHSVAGRKITFGIRR